MQNLNLRVYTKYSKDSNNDNNTFIQFDFNNIIYTQII